MSLRSWVPYVQMTLIAVGLIILPSVPALVWLLRDWLNY